MREETLRVREIHCADCEQAIRNSLGRVEGVGSVETDQATDSVRVSYDEARLNVEGIVGRLTDAGFPPVDTVE